MTGGEDSILVDKLILRTSDRETFRRCRKLWDFTSKIRQNWEYVPGVEPLDFGTAIHAALEVYYDPERWENDRSIVHQESILAFLEHMKDWRARLKKSNQWDLIIEDWNSLNDLGKGMLEHFFKWAPEEDKFWKPIHVEIEFEVPIPVPDGFVLSDGFRRGTDGNLYKSVGPSNIIANWVPVVYQGRIDLIVQDTRTGKYYIVDHKTRKQFYDPGYYELDTQASSYAWAIKKILGIDVAGVIFQELRKKAPEPPKVLKSGELSKDKSQGTTVELYTQEIEKRGLDPAPYKEFLEHIAVNGQEYFRRIPVDRTMTELRHIEGHVLNEAIDMFNSPRIYPNPSQWNCNGCMFKEPCLMSQDGSDVDYYLDQSLLYEVRSLSQEQSV